MILDKDKEKIGCGRRFSLRSEIKVAKIKKLLDVLDLGFDSLLCQTRTISACLYFCEPTSGLMDG